MSEEKKWYAVYTNSRCEKKVADLLIKQGIETYCPLNKVQKQWSDRKKIIYEPLFTSYVFVNIFKAEQTPVRQTHGILNFVYWLNKPAVIRNEEIKSIKLFLNEYNCIKLEKISVNKNDLVRIVSGPFMDMEGKVVNVKNKTVRILLPSLGYCMLAEVESFNVKIISEKELFR
jgi:transcription antitermination factor NusG